MEISISKKDLEKLYEYMEEYFVSSMNDAGVSFGAMAFAVETLHRAIKKASRTSLSAHFWSSF